MACYGVNESYAEVNPETTNPERKVEKVNKYEHDSGSELQNSRQGLVVSVKNNSPGKNFASPPPKKSKK